MRILITGSRNWSDRNKVARAIQHAVVFEEGLHFIVHGDCPTGADHIAHQYAEGAAHLVPEPHPANWEKYKKAAGYRRNAEMVALGADVCLAFIGACTKADHVDRPPHGSHGTDMTVTLAKKAGIPVTIFKEGWD